jgi:diguanylate cyclase (GGDEF)-like protein
MQASSLTSRIVRGLAFRDWAWWDLKPRLRLYVAAPPLVALVVIGILATRTDWRLVDVGTFLLLMCCGAISVGSTPRIMYATGGTTRDFSSVWVLPTAILLPPIYAALIPIPFYIILQMFVHRGILHRTVFTTASISLSYVAVAVIFRCFPTSFAGSSVGFGLHAFTWAVAVGACEIIGGRAQHFFIVGAVKLSNPQVRIFEMEWDREALQGLFVEIDLAVLITLAVGLSPALVVLALPTVLLVRRFLVHPLLLAQSRSDSKTGLLNVSTWEAEAEAEISRSVRTRNPVSLALVDIDHFKQVNDTHGHLVGDRVLKAVARALTSQSRDYDRAGRFGGEEFVLLLAQTTGSDAVKIAERLRTHVEGLEVPVDDRPGGPVVKVTISIGVTSIARGETRELIDLLAAADSALYQAKQGGRNQVACASPDRNMGLDAFNADLAAPRRALDDASPAADPEPAPGAQSPRGVQVHVQAKPTSLSLCQKRSLSVPISARHESDPRA